MKAVIYTKYGPPEVLQIKEIEKPTPKDNEILIKIHATAVNSGDCRMRSFNVPPLLWIPSRIALGIFNPRKPVLGLVLSGEIEKVGRKIIKYKAGDQIYATTMVGMKFGAYAQYVCLPENSLMYFKPSNLDYIQTVALLFGGISAIGFLRKAGIGKDMKVLIYGASGAVGTAAVQFAKYYGADITGVCSNTNLELVKSLGAGKTIDYTKKDMAEIKERYDIVFDAVGKMPETIAKSLLKPHGKYLSVIKGHIEPKVEDLKLINELAESGQYTAVIDKVYPLDEIVEAHRYVDKGHKRGNVIISIKHDD